MNHLAQFAPSPIHPALSPSDPSPLSFSTVYQDPYANKNKPAFFLQDPKDGMCLGSSGGFGPCDGTAVWILADRKEVRSSMPATLHNTTMRLCI